MFNYSELCLWLIRQVWESNSLCLTVFDHWTTESKPSCTKPGHSWARKLHFWSLILNSKAQAWAFVWLEYGAWVECWIESRRFETEYAVKSFFSSLTEKPFKPFFNSQQFKSVTKRFKPKQHLRPIFPPSSSPENRNLNRFMFPTWPVAAKKWFPA